MMAKECHPYFRDEHILIHNLSIFRFVSTPILFVTCLLLYSTDVHSHGGVFLEDDVCVIEIGFFKAHFTIFQPQLSQHEEFCEDVPRVGETIFSIEYLHDGLRDAAVDFRIIKDVLKLGRFAKFEDLKKIEDINRETIFYQPATVQQDGVFLSLHNFLEEGDYIGIVQANINTDNTYTAVFPFKVGGNDWGYLHLIIIIAIFLQLNYWLMNGGYKHLRKKFKTEK